MRIRTAVCAALGLLLACKGSERSAVSVGGKVLLRYHPPTGATYRYVMDQESKIAFDTGGAMGKMPDQQVTVTLYMSQAIGEASESRVSVVTTIDSTHFNSPMLGAMAGSMSDQMKGSHTTMVFDSRLRVVQADFSSLPGVPPALAQQMNGSMRGLIFELPEAAVGAGDSWTTNLELPFSQFGGSALTATTKLTVKDIAVAAGDTTVRLAVVTTFPENPITINAMGQSMTIKLAGSMGGEQVFSLTRGAIVSTSMAGTMQVAAKGGMLGSQGMAMRVNQQGTMKLLERQ